jgi:cyclopropane fatty-acyl-phospholipid synthase-like methyltransferase
MKHEPSRFEMFLTRLAFLFYGKSVYKIFADRLPLNGNERVLDFGCGMGTVAHYTARRLTHGHITCLDISERWLKNLPKNPARVFKRRLCSRRNTDTSGG